LPEISCRVSANPMHEMGIANSILEAVAKELRRHPGSHASKVGVRIGELAAVDPESLQFCFEAMTRETEFESLVLQVEFIPRRHRCGGCGKEFEVHDYEFQCPQCRSFAFECVAGEELDLFYIEVEDNGESSVGTKSP
jgi:hydrogenase nickel incorporation protein HypA/HybF